MGRRKSYRREDVVVRAMEAFWRDGFRGTSTEDLVEQTGMNRFSLYAEFGSKAGLFAEALAHYDEHGITSMIGSLEKPDASLETIRATLLGFAAIAGTPGSEKGCLLCNSATEMAGHDPETRRTFGRYVDRLIAAFANAARRAQAAGEIPPRVDIPERSEALALTVVGMFVMMRAAVDPRIIASAANTALAALSTEE